MAGAANLQLLANNGGLPVGAVGGFFIRGPVNGPATQGGSINGPSQIAGLVSQSLAAAASVNARLGNTSALLQYFAQGILGGCYDLSTADAATIRGVLSNPNDKIVALANGTLDIAQFAQLQHGVHIEGNTILYVLPGATVTNSGTPAGSKGLFNIRAGAKLTIINLGTLSLPAGGAYASFFWFEDIANGALNLVNEGTITGTNAAAIALIAHFSAAVGGTAVASVQQLPGATTTLTSAGVAAAGLRVSAGPVFTADLILQEFIGGSISTASLLAALIQDVSLVSSGLATVGTTGATIRNLSLVAVNATIVARFIQGTLAISLTGAAAASTITTSVLEALVINTAAATGLKTTTITPTAGVVAEIGKLVTNTNSALVVTGTQVIEKVVISGDATFTTAAAAIISLNALDVFGTGGLVTIAASFITILSRISQATNAADVAGGTITTAAAIVAPAGNTIVTTGV